jgi:hypothetical protein
MLAFRNESPPSWVCSMSRIVKRSTSQAVKSDPSGRSRHDFSPPAIPASAAFPASREAELQVVGPVEPSYVRSSHFESREVSRGFVLRGQKS